MSTISPHFERVKNGIKTRFKLVQNRLKHVQNTFKTHLKRVQNES